MKAVFTTEDIFKKLEGSTKAKELKALLEKLQEKQKNQGQK
jgi:hypothetical protein